MLILFGLTQCKTPQNKFDSSMTDFGFRDKWQYFNLQDTISAKIINHLPSAAHCGTLAFASVTLAETEKGDTIRILDLCNINKNYLVNQIVKISPAEKPNFNVSLPYTMAKNSISKKFEPISTDLKILKTTYGNLPR